MQNGIYKASFSVGTNGGEGIVVLRDGYIGGGDQGFTYEGSYTASGGQIDGAIEVRQWDATIPNVFAGLTNFHLTFQGKPVGMGMHLTGSTTAAPGATVNIVLTLIR